MARVSVTLLPRAVRELAELPDAIQDRVMEALDLLAEFPLLGVAMVGAFQNYRCLLAAGGRYRIIYKVVGTTRVEVAWFRHGRRQIGLRLV